MTELLTARQLADALGFSAATIVDWAERGELPGFKIGGRLRFDVADVLDWLEERRINGPGPRGEVSPTPNGVPARSVVSLLSPTPEGGD
jgi:excisionase family DNA binding protein